MVQVFLGIRTGRRKAIRMQKTGSFMDYRLIGMRMGKRGLNPLGKNFYDMA